MQAVKANFVLKRVIVCTVQACTVHVHLTYMSHMHTVVIVHCNYTSLLQFIAPIHDGCLQFSGLLSLSYPVEGTVRQIPVGATDLSPA